jgi:hypothetical protein
MSTSIGVISDLHGSVALLHGILRTIGATDEYGKRSPGWHLTSVGDLVGRSMVPRHIKIPREAYDERGFLPKNLLAQMCLVEQARDAAILEEAELLLDGVTMGNHEGADWGLVDFRGYDRAESPVKQKVRDLTRSGFIHAAEAHGDWLVTHAGLVPDYWDMFKDLSAGAVAEQLNTVLDEMANVPGGSLDWSFKSEGRSVPGYLNSIGNERWGGPFRMATRGGIMWAHWTALVEGYDEHFGRDEPVPTDALKQIVGHTPPLGPEDPPVRRNKRYPLVNIDSGANEWWRCSAAVSHDGGKTWETHTYHNVLKV